MGKKEVGERIKIGRESRHMTQVQLAEMLGVGYSTIGMWENGQRRVNIDTLEAIADIFNVPLSYLMEGEDVKKAPGEITKHDYDRLEALHQNPRLGLLFDRQRLMSESDIEMMLALADRIVKERDSDD